MAISEQETSSYFAATKKKIKLEKGNGVGDKVEKTRTLDKGNVSINAFVQKLIFCIFFSSFMVKFMSRCFKLLKI